ncbi:MULTISPECIES: phenol hydroxylase [Sphingobium]|uniref:Phenol hydroxylase P1 protein n=2 Tax=Sphingobium TaxID=165695 RepID=A0A292ZLI4_SPHSA|nr:MULTISPECIES: phenol hydroxylase [Sphingobium]AJR23853.1 phenol hydroxylase [Sphingobium sp. YBL2]MCB4857968.1 phenol hydroxylase [Sphingobium sp. PNB]PNQ04506.1 phenol hydroxylase [Sphingobium sp. SA916]RYL97251.1 phenol hydroxylase [Sphingobium fuliginis]WDA35665.1 phenol hydroxylase [Sphingobium sp. YC-XJ3]
MQMDLRTVTIAPQRQTYGHVARHIGGDKPASRYQEGTIGLQTTGNQHYRPLWDPAHDYFDESRTKLKMADWYAFRDPRQYYYGSYVLARARQQEAAEAAFDFVETRGLADALPDDIRALALDLILPLRHVAWGASMNNDFIAAYGYGTGITQPALYYAMDQLGIAQFDTRLGLLLAEPEALDAAKEAWLHDVRWQSLRRLVEDLFVEQDWFELFVAQDLVLDGLLYPLVFQTIVDGDLAQRGGAAVAMVTQFQNEWAAETRKWVDAQIKAACADDAGNAALIGQWIAKWTPRAAAALCPLAEMGLGDRSAAVMDELCAALDARAARAGVRA